MNYSTFIAMECCVAFRKNKIILYKMLRNIFLDI